MRAELVKELTAFEEHAQRIQKLLKNTLKDFLESSLLKGMIEQYVNDVNNIESFAEEAMNNAATAVEKEVEKVDQEGKKVDQEAEIAGVATEMVDVVAEVDQEAGIAGVATEKIEKIDQEAEKDVVDQEVEKIDQEAEIPEVANKIVDVVAEVAEVAVEIADVVAEISAEKADDVAVENADFLNNTPFEISPSLMQQYDQLEKTAQQMKKSKKRKHPFDNAPSFKLGDIQLTPITEEDETFVKRVKQGDMNEGKVEVVKGGVNKDTKREDTKNKDTMKADVLNEEVVNKDTMSKDTIIGMMQDALFKNMEVQNEITQTPDKSILCLAQSISSVKPEQKKPQRKKFLSDAMCLPYIRRQVNMMERRTVVENNVSSYIFSGFGDPLTTVFQISGVISPFKVIMESLRPEIDIHVDVINTWAHILNQEERRKSRDSIYRLFCTAPMIYRDTYGKSAVMILKEFTLAFEEVLRKESLTSIKEFGLIFIPVGEQHHFYLICFNMKDSKCYLIDNSSLGEFDKYKEVPQKTKKAFAGYLYSISYPKAKEIDETEIVRLEMPWRTTSNRTDCGIFTMRHMETYMGEDEKAWRCGFGLEAEKVQKAQIEDL